MTKQLKCKPVQDFESLPEEQIADDWGTAFTLASVFEGDMRIDSLIERLADEVQDKYFQ